jgi:hypothetical protein
MRTSGTPDHEGLSGADCIVHKIAGFGCCVADEDLSCCAAGWTCRVVVAGWTRALCEQCDMGLGVSVEHRAPLLLCSRLNTRTF